MWFVDSRGLECCTWVEAIENRNRVAGLVDSDRIVRDGAELIVVALPLVTNSSGAKIDNTKVSSASGIHESAKSRVAVIDANFVVESTVQRPMLK